MLKFGKGVVKSRFVIFIVAILLLIPSALGYIHTRVNYDILSYLPEDIETMKGQDILMEEFGTGAFSTFVVDGMSNREVSDLKAKIEQVDHVKSVLWYDSFADISIPADMLPEKIQDVFLSDEGTLMFILYDTTMSADETMQAVEDIRAVSDKQCFLSGMSAVVTDIRDLSDKEVPVYVILAVVLSLTVLSLTMDSFLVPFFFLLSIGMAIVYNLGTNIFMGEISYVTKALSAVLQLGVTMDYSIFLWHSYESWKEDYPDNHMEAMTHAIAGTISSVVGSSVTTVAGFIALCFMSFKLGMDLGIVMAKGVVIGVIGCVTILPSMILIFDRALEKSRHRALMPDMGKISGFVVKHFWIFVIVFGIILAPAVYGQKNAVVYYDLAGTLPEDLQSFMANEKLDEEFDLNATHILLADSKLKSRDAEEMLKRIDEVDGVKAALGMDTVLGPAFPKDMLPESLRKILMDENYQMILISSEYKTASDEVNAQIDAVNDIVKDYDPKGMLIGEAPCTKDLISITDTDFKVVSAVSIAAIFIIIALVFRSIILPFILVAVIEFAIYVNMSVPFYTNTPIPFIASIVIGTIQLGATVDYAILMTNQYKSGRASGLDKKTAVQGAVAGSAQSILVSALSFFAATFGVGVYSNIDMISSLCMLMSRGALISMAVVVFVLPAMYMIFDKVICTASAGFKSGRKEKKSNEIYESKTIS